MLFVSWLSFIVVFLFNGKDVVMSRVEIVFPEHIHFITELSVRIGDINQGNHLGHDRLITMVHEARIQFFKSLGYDELDIEGVGTLIADLAISYKNEAFHGELLKFEIAVHDISSKSCQFSYRVIRVGLSDEHGASSKSRELIALAKTGVVFFDYALRKSAVIPIGFIEQLDKKLI